jgi:protein phosphatase
MVRAQNQDACAFQQKDGYAWAVVCDGMGGAAAGDLASTMARDRYESHMAYLEAPTLELEEGDLMLQAVQDANRAVYLKAGTNRAFAGMGTTLVGALIRDHDLWMVNVGDSRGYRVTGGHIRQITRDHSVVEELIQHGALTPEEARRHPQRNLITRALGTTKQVKADLFRETLVDGDAILLCSDGLVNEVTDQEILQEVLAGGTAAEVCHRLLDRALDAGASDNVTVVLFQV